MTEPNWATLTPNERLEALAQHAEEHALWHAAAMNGMSAELMLAAMQTSSQAVLAGNASRNMATLAEAYRAQFLPVETPPL